MTDVVQLNGVGKMYRLGDHVGGNRTLSQTLRRRSLDSIWALRDIDLTIAQGEIVGLVGGNGAGKSTLLKVVARVTAPTVGWAQTRGQVGSLLEVGAGFYGELTGRENLYLNGQILGMTRREVEARFDEIVAFSNVEKQLDTPVKRYSSGQYLRLAFAVAAHLDAGIMLVDEVLAVGDTAFQQRCLEKLRSLALEGRTVLYVSHQLTTVSDLCNRVVWLRGGTIEQDGPVGETLSAYRNSMVGTGDGVPWLELNQVETLADSGLPANRFTEEELVEIAVTYTIAEPVPPNASMKLLITDHQGMVVTEPAITTAATPQGSYTSRVRFPGRLAPGFYSVGVTITDGSMVLFSDAKIDKFQIASMHGDEVQSGRGVLRVPASDVVQSVT